MSVFARAACLVSVAFVLFQLALPAPAQTGFCGDTADTTVEVRNAPHPAAYGARASLPDAIGDHVADTPFGLAAPAPDAVSQVNALAPASGSARVVADAYVILPPSRAPPPHS